MSPSRGPLRLLRRCRHADLSPRLFYHVRVSTLTNDPPALGHPWPTIHRCMFFFADAGITSVTAGTAPAHPTPSAAAACESSTESVLASATTASASPGEHSSHAGGKHVERSRGLAPHSSRHCSACSAISTSHMRRAMACSTISHWSADATRHTLVFSLERHEKCLRVAPVTHDALTAPMFCHSRPREAYVQILFENFFSFFPLLQLILLFFYPLQMYAKRPARAWFEPAELSPRAPAASLNGVDDVLARLITVLRYRAFLTQT